MDLTVILAIVSGVVIVFLFSFLWHRSKSKSEADEDEVVPRRAVDPRARARLRAAQQRVVDHEEEKDGLEPEKEKMGAKKRAKLEAKAEKKAHRELEEREREAKKKKKEQAEEERKRLEEKEKEEERLKEEQEKREEEERLKREHEEYLKLKSAFSVEEEGYDDVDISENVNLLQEFISYIENMKVVTFEDLGAKFNMKSQSVIERVQGLQNEGRLTGVVDDRGKFIYITRKELESVVKFIKQRGRVSLTELVENSHRLINLTPNIEVKT
ncbi:DDRGK domain-containing protein 1 [Cimex lectularius]|uniref:DDRGK domain-containing protein 1 n=1 Tax=Cimex lectularius TaxID=79782 RepID=A0A8I6R9B3_CIMLE|nr:DDRGK domain-containing protein 1 [Cimex lectularius]